MRSRFVLLVIITTILIIAWTGLEFILTNQLKQIYQTVSNYPVVCYSYNLPLLDNLQKQMKTKNYVDRLVLQNSDMITKELIQSYSLQEAADIIEGKTLPNVLLVYLKGSKFSWGEKTQLATILAPFKAEMVIDYQDNIWKETFNRAKVVEQSHLVGTILVGLVLFLVFFFMRLHHEHVTSEYWQIFHRAGGDIAHRSSYNWLNSLLIVGIPMLCTVLLYFILTWQYLIAHVIDYRFFLLQFGILLLSNVVAVFWNRKHYESI